MKRCVACGGFFEGDDCPNDHSHIEEYTPPLPPEPVEAPFVELRGRVALYEWPTNGDLVLGVLTDRGSADGTVGFSILAANLRVPLADLKEIPDGSTTP